MDELATTFGSIGEVHRSRYVNTYDRFGRSLASYVDHGSAARIAGEWKRIAPDVIHLNKQNLEDGLDLLQAARLTHFPSLATIHLTQSAKYLGARFPGPRDFFARRALQAFPGMLVTVLEDRRHDLAQFMGDSPRLRTIANGVPLFDLSVREEQRSRTRAALGIDAASFLVVAVGRMVPQKRPLAFLELASRLHQERPNARCLWIGDGPLAGQWDQWVSAHQPGDAIRRLPWQSNVSGFLFASDLFLHVAEYEGLPLAVLEALSAAVPCAITANLRAEMPFLNDTNSVAVRDDGEWIREIADAAGLAARGTAGRQLAEERFSYETMAGGYEALYEEARRSGQ